MRTQTWTLAGVAGGIIAGVACTIAPLAICALVIGALVVTVAGSGLPRSEQRLLRYVLLAALLTRVVAIGAMFLWNTPRHADELIGLLSGDEAYNLGRALRARDILLNAATSQYDYFFTYDEYSRNSYVSLLTILQVLFGPTLYSVRLLNSLIFVAAAVLLFRLAHAAFGSLAAFLGLILILFLPTLFAWSTSLLKEPLYFLGTALVLTGAITTIRGESRMARVRGALALGLGLVIIRDLRPGALVLATSGLALGIFLRLIGESSLRLALSSAAAGIAALLLLTQAPIQQRVLTGLEAAAKVHSGHVFTVGHAYKLLDAGFYLNPQTPSASTLTLSVPQAGRFTLRGLASLIAVPWPWQLESRRELLYLPEQLLWYMLVALLLPGVLAGWRRDRLVTCVLAGYIVPTAVALALTNGNVGTLLRLRGIIIPYVAWLSMIGLCAALQRVAPKGNDREGD